MDSHSNLFDRLGGVRKIAKDIGKPTSTIQSWKTAGRIPAHEQPDFIAAYAALGVVITTDDVVFPMGREQAAA